MADFGFDEDRELDRIEAKADRLAASHQLVIEDLADQYSGRPAAEIAPILAERWHDVAGGSLGRDELVEWSSWISGGEPIMILASAHF